MPPTCTHTFLNISTLFTYMRFSLWCTKLLSKQNFLMCTTVELSSIWSSVTLCPPTKLYPHGLSLIWISARHAVIALIPAWIPCYLLKISLLLCAKLTQKAAVNVTTLGCKVCGVWVRACVCVISRAYSLSSCNHKFYCQYHWCNNWIYTSINLNNGHFYFGN